MTAYRAGQRVRIEWPNGSAVEGYVMRDLCYVEYSFGRALDMVAAEQDPPEIRPTVTVLSEPRPDEPTGLGAVVDDRLGTVWVRVDHRGSGLVCWREVTPGRYDSDACMREWKHVDAVRILSEGWTP